MEISLESLRRQIGIVQQQVLLKNASVAENILFGNPDSSEQEIKQAAARAHAKKFINELPDFSNTIIDDQGIKLSGGQKQRLALARVLLKNPTILILNEATAMFDPESETAFIQECRKVIKQKTVILITNRPGSLILADTTYKLVKGQLIQVR